MRMIVGHNVGGFLYGGETGETSGQTGFGDRLSSAAVIDSCTLYIVNVH